MKTTTLTTAAVTLGLTFLTAASASAAVIITENFGGAAGTGLNGKTTDSFAAGITTAGGSNAWLAKTSTADFKRNGSVIGSGTASSASLNVGSYINDARGTANGVFVLSATVSAVTGASWLSLGFSTSNTPSTSGSFTTSSNGRANMLYRTTGDIDQYRGGGNNNEVAAASEDLYTGTRTLTITLDFSPSAYNGTTTFGTVRFGADVGAGNAYQEFGSDNFANATEATIGSIILSAVGASNGTYDNLKLEQIPEPGTALLGGLGLLALLRRRR